MGFLNRLTGRPYGDQPSSGTDARSRRVELIRPDRVDPFLADRELRAAYRVMVDGDWPRLERFLQVSPKAWQFSSIITGDIVGMETVVFQRWVAFKRSPQSRVMLANALVRDAFAQFRAHRDTGVNGPIGTARATNGWAPTPLAEGGVGETEDAGTEPTIDGFLDEEDDRFITRLSAAEELLYEVIGERPAMVDPWVGLLISGRGLQVDLDELRERFENAHSREPFRPDACLQYLQGLTKKWGGSNVASFDLARWIEVEAMPSAPARQALPVAHVERGLLQSGTRDISRYLSRTEVVAELSDRLIDFLRSTPAPAGTESLGVLNAYALALHVSDRKTAGLITETLARIDNRPTEWPWIVFSDDVAAVFAEVQAKKLRAASRFG